MSLFLDFLFPPRVDEKVTRDTTLDDFLGLVSPKLVPETRPETVTLLTFNDERVRSALHEAKYHGSELAFAHLGSALAEYLADPDAWPAKSIIIPIPLGRQRRKERGFNQAEEIAKHALRALDASARFVLEIDLLERVRETKTQIALPREEREKNMRGAFRVPQGAALNPSHLYVILDDVITTGATLQSAVLALQNAGAIHILPIALAH